MVVKLAIGYTTSGSTPEPNGGEQRHGAPVTPAITEPRILLLVVVTPIPCSSTSTLRYNV